MAVYGLMSYDIAVEYDAKGKEVHRKAVYAVPGGLGDLGWLKTADSTYTGDLSQAEKVMDLLRKHLTNPRDVILPVIRVDKDSEKGLREWVRIAQSKFFEEVVSKMRVKIDEWMELLDEGKLGLGDVMEKFDSKAKEIREKIEDIMLKLVTFRLDGDFQEFRTAKLAEIEVAESEVMCKLATKALELKNADKAKSETVGLKESA
jgi:hypothetical protein